MGGDTLSRFHGPQPGQKLDRGPNHKKGPKGVRKMDNIKKRQEAEARQKKSRSLKIKAIMDEELPAYEEVFSRLADAA